jgi:hypothetical protein
MPPGPLVVVQAVAGSSPVAHLPCETRSQSGFLRVRDHRLPVSFDLQQPGCPQYRPQNPSALEAGPRTRHGWFVALGRGKLDEQPTATGHAVAARAGHLNLAVTITTHSRSCTL